MFLLFLLVRALKIRDLRKHFFVLNRAVLRNGQTKVPLSVFHFCFKVELLKQ